MWHHSPAHRLTNLGAYMVTAGTYRRLPLFAEPAKREATLQKLFELAKRNGWELQAWAILPNHYHFIAVTAMRPGSLPAMIREFHSRTAREVNSADAAAGRKVWFQYWDTHVTYQRSYFARLNYVHSNPVHHHLVADARQYRWCSAGWFERTATPAFHKMVTGFRYDTLRVPDDF